jgi:hypothetical protein
MRTNRALRSVGLAAADGLLVDGLSQARIDWFSGVRPSAPPAGIAAAR